MSRIISFHICGRIGFLWVPRSAYTGMTRREWCYSTSHDSYSWWWQILGWQINIPRDDR